MDTKVNFGKILDIICYKGDQEELYNNLLGLCYMNALANLIEGLSEDKREQAEREILQVKHQQQADSIKKYFSESQIDGALKKSSEKIFQDYYNSIKPSLSKAQVLKLNNYLGSVFPQSA